MTRLDGYVADPARVECIRGGKRQSTGIDKAEKPEVRPHHGDKRAQMAKMLSRKRTRAPSPPSSKRCAR